MKIRMTDEWQKCPECEGTGKDLNRFDGMVGLRLGMPLERGPMPENLGYSASGYRYYKDGPDCTYCSGSKVVQVALLGE